MIRAAGLALAIVAVLVAALSGWLVSRQEGVPRPQALRPLAGLPLRGAAGSTVTVEDYRGKVVVLVFGCVSCWENGDSILEEMRRALRRLGGSADEVQVLVVSIAPAQETVDSVAARATASGRGFVGLMASPEVMQRVAALGLVTDDPEAAPVMVLDQRGHLRLAFPFRISAPSFAEDLAVLLRPMHS
ncbi:MAG: SCO family protein [Candidatus Tectomicrobia bacterium]|nr:SCO family protein [Candidatus Tectomicrobia bacterium]